MESDFHKYRRVMSSGEVIVFYSVFLHRSDGRVAIHPSSVNSDEKQFASQWLVYHDKVIYIDP